MSREKGEWVTHQWVNGLSNMGHTAGMLVWQHLLLVDLKEPMVSLSHCVPSSWPYSNNANYLQHPAVQLRPVHKFALQPGEVLQLN